MMTLSEVYLRIAPGRFHFLKFILEGYDNLAILSSYQKLDCIVVIRYPREKTRELFGLLSSLADYLAKQHQALP